MNTIGLEMNTRQGCGNNEQIIHSKILAVKIYNM